MLITHKYLLVEWLHQGIIKKYHHFYVSQLLNVFTPENCVYPHLISYLPRNRLKEVNAKSFVYFLAVYISLAGTLSLSKPVLHSIVKEENCKN